MRGSNIYKVIFGGLDVMLWNSNG